MFTHEITKIVVQDDGIKFDVTQTDDSHGFIEPWAVVEMQVKMSELYKPVIYCDNQRYNYSREDWGIENGFRALIDYIESIYEGEQA